MIYHDILTLYDNVKNKNILFDPIYQISNTQNLFS